MVDISYKTHPTWRVLDAVYASSCAPILFSPHVLDEKHETDISCQSIVTKYVDGGFLIHYPIEQCLQWCDKHGYARDTVLGINLLTTPEQTTNNHLLNKYTLLDYFYTVTKHFYHMYSELTVCEYNYLLQEKYPYEIHIHPTLHVMDVITIARSGDERRKLIQHGQKEALQFNE